MVERNDKKDSRILFGRQIGTGERANISQYNYKQAMQKPDEHLITLRFAFTFVTTVASKSEAPTSKVDYLYLYFFFVIVF